MRGNRKLLVWTGTIVVALAIGIIPAAVILILWMWIEQLRSKRPNALNSDQRGFEVQVKAPSQENDVP